MRRNLEVAVLRPILPGDCPSKARARGSDPAVSNRCCSVRGAALLLPSAWHILGRVCSISSVRHLANYVLWGFFRRRRCCADVASESKPPAWSRLLVAGVAGGSLDRSGDGTMKAGAVNAACVRSTADLPAGRLFTEISARNQSPQIS